MKLGIRLLVRDFLDMLMNGRVVPANKTRVISKLVYYIFGVVILTIHCFYRGRNVTSFLVVDCVKIIMVFSSFFTCFSETEVMDTEAYIYGELNGAFSIFYICRRFNSIPSIDSVGRCSVDWEKLTVVFKYNFLIHFSWFVHKLRSGYNFFIMLGFWCD